MNTTSLPDIDFDSWYRSYAAPLRFAARRIVHNAEDAEDALQEAFLAAFRSGARYDGSNPYPWLHRIATRKALTIASSRPMTVDVGEEHVGAAPSAEDEAIAGLQAQAVLELVRREPVVAQHLIGGLRFREISERFGMSPATAATRIRRGKRRLRSRLEATLAYLPESKPA